MPGNSNLQDSRAAKADEFYTPLFENFWNIIEWVKKLFPTYRKQMKGIDWGFLYRNYGSGEYDSEKLEEEVAALMTDKDEVQNQSGKTVLENGQMLCRKHNLEKGDK